MSKNNLIQKPKNTSNVSETIEKVNENPDKLNKS